MDRSVQSTEKLSSVTYEVQGDPNTKPIVVHIDDLKPYMGEVNPYFWQNSNSNMQSQIDIDTKVTDSDKTDYTNETEVSEPYYTRYGRQIKPPDQFIP